MTCEVYGNTGCSGNVFPETREEAAFLTTGIALKEAMGGYHTPTKEVIFSSLSILTNPP